MKKYIPALCAILFVGVFSITPTFSAANIPFSDIKDSYLYDPAIQTLLSKGLITGYPDGSLKPENAITRAEFLKMTLLSTYTSNEITTLKNSGFKDIPRKHWVAPYTAYAVQKGIVSGHPDGTFRTNEVITEAEALKILVRTRFPFESIPKPTAKQQWFDPYIALAIQKNIKPLSGEWIAGKAMTRKDAFYILAATLTQTTTSTPQTNTNTSTPSRTSTTTPATQNTNSNTSSSSTKNNTNSNSTSGTTTTTPPVARTTTTIPTR